MTCVLFKLNSVTRMTPKYIHSSYYITTDIIYNIGSNIMSQKFC